MKRVFLTVLLCAAAARAEIKERIAAIVNGQPILLSDVEERIGPELTRVMQQAPGPHRDKERADLLHRGLAELVEEKLIESEASTLGLTVSEEELQRALEQLARQQGMELADFRQALELARAEQALRRVKAGETFALVAREMSEGPTAKQGGDLGYFRHGLMLPAIEQAAFSLNPGEVSQVIRTNSGYHIVLVEDRRVIPPKPLAEIKEEIRSRLANDSVFKERENYLATLRKTAQIDEKL